MNASSASTAVPDLPHLPRWPRFTAAQIEAAERVLRSGRVNYWTGDECRLFEEEFAEFVGSRYAVAVANGTVALELALRALGVSHGDEVLVPSATFIATASAVVACGARPICVDVDLDSQSMTRATLEPHLTERTRGIVPVHLLGWPAPMSEILEFAREHELFVLEDCAQAHGATYKGQTVGSLGDAAAFSFCQDKILTTGGEGGMVVTSHERVWRRVWEQKDHGKSYDAVFHRDHPPGFRWVHESFGTNARMTELQAAIGREGLVELPEWLERRKKNAAHLDEFFAELPYFRVPSVPDHCRHAYYKYGVFVQPEELPNGWSRDALLQRIVSKGVPCYQGICPEIYREKAFPNAGWAPEGRHENAQKIWETGLMFLVHPPLGEDHMAHVVRALGEAVSEMEASVKPC